MSPASDVWSTPAFLEDLSAWVAGVVGAPPLAPEQVHVRFDDVDGVCAELTASGVPISIQHDDLHGGNVCEQRVIDWGDASWGFPLGTMLVTLDAIAGDAACDVDDPRVQRARDAYLEPFGARWSRADLVRWTGLARWVGAVAPALS